MDEEKTIREHLVELRKVLLTMFLPLIVLFILFFYLSGPLMIWLTDYMNLEVFSLVPLENLYARAMVATSLTILFGLPVIFTGLYRYAKPVISEKHKKVLLFVVIVSFLLSFIGVLLGVFIFARFILFTLGSQYLIAEPMWGVASVIRYIIASSVALAFIMQIILILPILVKSNLVSVETLSENRTNAFIIISILSALLSPPDLISMFIMIIPIYFSYELGVFISKLTKPSKKYIKQKD